MVVGKNPELIQKQYVNFLLYVIFLILILMLGAFRSIYMNRCMGVGILASLVAQTVKNLPAVQET